MHDLYAAQDILKAALATAKQKKLKRITKLVISLGHIEDHGDVISPENLTFNLNLLRQDTIAGKAEIIIRHVDGHDCILQEIEGDTK
ncbi:MAG: hydrogenase/urease maturation nickel metallochaperone HypA [Patescibacteria group bacterium]